MLTIVLMGLGMASGQEKETAAVPQQGVELLFPAGTGKQVKGAKLSKEQKRAASLLQKLKAIEKGGDINATDKQGQTALMHAVAADNRLAICWLVAKGADATIRNKKGETAAGLTKDKQIQEFLTVISRMNEPLNEEEKEISARFFTKGNEGAMASPTGFRPSRVASWRSCTLTELGVLLRNPQIKIESDWLSYSYRQKQLTPEVMSIYLRRGTLDIATKDEKGESVWIAPDFKSSSITLARALGVVPQGPEKKLLVALTSDNMALVEQLIKETPALINSPFIRQHGKEKISLPLLCFASSRNMIDLLYKLGIDDSDSVIPENERNLYYYENRREFIILELIERVPTKNMDEVLTCLKGHGWQLPQFCLHYVLKEDGANLTRLGREEKALLLIKAGADINAEMGYLKETPLFLAAVYDFPSVAAMLIKKGANVNAALAGGYTEGITPLHLAESTEMAAILLKAGANPNATDSDGMTPLSHARKETILPLVKAGADVNARDNNGETPLFRAEDPAAVSALIQAGADVNARNNAGKSVLQYAKEERRGNDIIKLLQEHGAKEEKNDPNERDAMGRTRLMLAVRKNGSEGEIQSLLRQGADVNARDDKGNTALHCLLTVAGNIDARLAALLAAHPDVNLATHQGTTPLMILDVCRDPGERVSRVKKLLELHAKVDLKDAEGRTAAMRYVEKDDNAEALRLLLDAGADTELKNKDGKTVLDIASENHRNACIKLLNERNASGAQSGPGARDSEGRTPADAGRSQKWE